MITADMIEGLLNSGFSEDLVRKVIECKYNELEGKARKEMEWSMDNLKNQIAIRKIYKSF